MPSPSSQSSPDAHLEKLMDAFHIAAQQINLAPQLVHNSVTGSAVTRRYFAARQSLREFLSERTLTEQEARYAVSQWGCSTEQIPTREFDHDTWKSALAKLRRRASMKEPPE